MGGDGETWIDYRGPPGTMRTYSYSRVLRGQVPARAFRDKIVVVGAAAPSLQDLHATSTSGDELMSGPELQANAIWTAAHGFPLDSSPGWLNVFLIVLLGLAAPAAALRLRPVLALGLAVALGGAYAVAAQLAFNSGTIAAVRLPAPCARPVRAGGAGGQLSDRRLRAPAGARHIRPLRPRGRRRRGPGARRRGLRLGGIQREGTVMFCDLRGFTSFAESLPPAQVIELLNRYLSGMSDAILDNGGTLVAYMGDGIMAVFGAPIEQDDHADRALAAAREMLTVRLPEFNEWLRTQGSSRGSGWGSASTAAR